MLRLEQLLRIPQIDGSLRYGISDDENRIVYSWNKSGMAEIWLLDLVNQTNICLTQQIEGGKFSPRFSPDGTHIAYALDKDGSESFHIILHDLQNNCHIDLTPRHAYAQQPNFDFSPDGKSLAILSDERGQFALYLLSTETLEKKLLLDVHQPIWDTAWSPDGKCIAVEAESTASDRTIYIVDVRNGENFQIKLDDEILNAQHPCWSPDSSRLAFSAENGEWHNIAVLNIKPKEITWMTESTGDDTQPVWSRSGDLIGWVHAEGAMTSFQSCTEPRRSVKERDGSIQQVKVGEGVHSFPQIISNSVVLLYEDPNRPCDLWKIDLDNGRAQQLTKSLEGALDFIQPEEVWYTGMNATEIPALLHRAENSDAALIYIHGGPNWNLQFSWNPILSYMAARGWTVLAPNYRGSTGYGKKWQNASRFDFGGVDNDDCAAGVKYLVENGLAAKNKIAVTGRSHGGYLTMTCLTTYPELFAGGSAVVPFLNWFKSHAESREDLQHWNIENMGDPQENQDLWRQRSPYFHLGKINAPVQMICGGNDPRCPASDSLDARDKLVELGKVVELLLYEDEGHSFLKIENVIDAEVKRLEFLQSVLK